MEQTTVGGVLRGLRHETRIHIGKYRTMGLNMPGMVVCSGKVFIVIEPLTNVHLKLEAILVTQQSVAKNELFFNLNYAILAIPEPHLESIFDNRTITNVRMPATTLTA